MKQRVPALLFVLALMLSASACSSVYEEEYSYAKPYEEEITADDSGSGTEIKNYSQLKSVINAMVNTLSAGGELRFSNYDGSVSDDMAAACYEVKTQNPVGAYAVETLDYELSRIVSYYTAQVTVSYRCTAEEMARVTSVNGVSALQSHLREAVMSYTTDLALKVYSSTVNENYITAVIENVALTEPLLVTAAPELRVESYPNEGVNRIYTIALDYGMSQSDIHRRTEELNAAVSRICSELYADNSAKLALACARYLSLHCQTLLESEAEGHNTSYDALVEGKAGSYGVAQAYAALCSRLGLECRFVQGSFGTMGVEAHYWNIIALDGAYYHVDVSRMAQAGEAAVFLLSDEQAWGEYMWAYEAYPDCSGTLTYGEVAGVPSQEEESAAGDVAESAENGGEGASGEVTEAPAATVPPALEETAEPEQKK